MLWTARRRAGLSQRELSRISAVPQPTISRIERALVSPGMDTVQRLLRACGMEVVAVDRPREDDVDRGLIRERPKMTPEQRLRYAVEASRKVRELLGKTRRVS